MRSKNIHSDGVGNGADSDFINRILEKQKESEIYDSPTIGVQKTTRGQHLYLKSVYLNQSNLPQLFLVKDDLGSSLKCFSWDGTNEGSMVYVAKKESIRIVNQGDNQSGVAYTYTYAQGDADAASLSGDVVAALTGGVGDGSGSPNTIANDVSSMHYWTRTVAGGPGEVDVITPPFLFNCIIKAVAITPETLDGHVCSFQEITGREWAIKP